ncbi:hypothetical protein HMPREF1051_2623 [Neisseria sicca VK64]|uniref:Uncharacterized protein n=1 Tax=Neisseria sicca VK64 TaxID=1095748 RepID=I2NU55_NEISI|nr:hypothetical protein HMPREF1051_2623 [Neisseria sicca VK64]
MAQFPQKLKRTVQKETMVSKPFSDDLSKPKPARSSEKSKSIKTIS